MKAKIRSAIFAGQQILFPKERVSRLNVVGAGIGNDDKEEIRRRAAFFLPKCQEVVFSDSVTPAIVASPAPVAFFNTSEPVKTGMLKGHSGVFNIDFRTNPMDGWAWCEIATYAEGGPDIELSKERYRQYQSKLLALGYTQCYLLGTGPSLGTAINRDWSDGLRVVCNTIVKDPELWHHVKPHIVVAGDAIYHFGFTAFARAFRSDLHKRMSESDAFFIYPDYFDVLVRREFAEFADRLIPIPTGTHHTVHGNFLSDYSLPALGNVLNKLLLPVGCNLSKKIGLWGFDGRAPNDKLFWANSERHSYGDLMHTLQAAHPAFFDHFVPRANPEQYAASVHGDVLEHCLSSAEAEGWSFEMLHPTWTPTLQRRLTPGLPIEPVAPAEALCG